jgi:hypothetical protein
MVLKSESESFSHGIVRLCPTHHGIRNLAWARPYVQALCCHALNFYNNSYVFGSLYLIFFYGDEPNPMDAGIKNTPAVNYHLTG